MSDQMLVNETKAEFLKNLNPKNVKVLTNAGEKGVYFR